MREMRERERVRVRVRVSECGRKIRNANRMPKSDDRTSREEGGKVGGRQFQPPQPGPTVVLGAICCPSSSTSRISSWR